MTIKREQKSREEPSKNAKLHPNQLLTNNITELIKLHFVE